MEPTNTEQHRWEQIDSYLRGELNTSEKADFDAQLAQNTSLTEEVESIRSAGSLVRNYGQREELKAIHQKMLDSQKHTQSTVFQGINFYLRIAAIIVFLVVAWSGIGFATLTPSSLYADEYSGYVPDAVRGAESPKRPKTEQLMQVEYVNANYVRVAQLYKESASKTLKETFIAGNAYLALDQPNIAASCFKRVMYLSAKENTYDYYQDAEYYLAWSYLKNNQLNEAIKLFDKIYHSEFHTHNPDVDSWFYWKLKLLQWKKK